MGESEGNGCLVAILSAIGLRLGPRKQPPPSLPYRQCDNFLSPAELSFYRVLTSALSSTATVCPKVNLADIFFVTKPNENRGARNRIDRKHVDFLVCHPKTMRPQCGIELDDSTHSRPARQQRDALVDDVFRAAGLPLIHVPARASYSTAEILAQVQPYLNGDTTTAVAQPVRRTTTEPPLCPKCGVPMVKRVAKQGENVGREFFGCPNYPSCKAIAPIS